MSLIFDIADSYLLQVQKYEVPSSNSSINSGIKLPNVKPVTTPGKMSVSMPPKSNVQSMSKSPISAGAPLIKVENENDPKSQVSNQKPAGSPQVKLVRQGGAGNSQGVSLVRVQNNQALAKSVGAPTSTTSVTRSTSKPQQIVMVMSPSANKGEIGKVTFTTTQTVTLAQGQKSYTAAELNQIIQLSQQGTALKIVSMTNQASSSADALSHAGVKFVQRQANGQVIIKMVNSGQSTSTTTTLTPSPAVQSKVQDIPKIMVERPNTKSLADSSTSSSVSSASTTSADSIITSSTQVTSSTSPAVSSATIPILTTALTTTLSNTQTTTKANESISDSTAETSTSITKVTSTSGSVSSLEGSKSASQSDTPDPKVSSSTNPSASGNTINKPTISTVNTAVTSSTTTSDSPSEPSDKQSDKSGDTPDSSTPSSTITSEPSTTPKTSLSTTVNSSVQNTLPLQSTLTSTPSAATSVTGSISKNSELHKIATLASANTKLENPAKIVSRPVTCGGSTTQQSTIPITATSGRDMAPPAAVNPPAKVKSAAKTVRGLLLLFLSQTS